MRFYCRQTEPLCVVTQDSMTVDEVESLLKETEHNGFPVVISHDSPFLVGFVLRRDLNLAISNARRTVDGVDGSSLCLFTNNHPPTQQLRPVSSKAIIRVQGEEAISNSSDGLLRMRWYQRR